MAILVGIDDSVQGTAALRWAAREAALRNTPLRILHAFPWPMAGVVGDPRHLDLWNAAERLVEEAKYWAREIARDVSTELVTDGPAEALVHRSGEFELTVVGTRGHGGFHGLLVGSVALQVAGHANGPVTLVGPELEPAASDIVVGVGDHAKDETLGAAFAEAALRGARLLAIHAWQLYATPSLPSDAVLPAPTVKRLRRQEEQRVISALAPWRAKYPEVPVASSVIRDTPRHALIKASDQAALLVMGASEHDDHLGLPLGSVPHAMAHHAKCPILIAR